MTSGTNWKRFWVRGHMSKVHIANYEPDKTGGGWTFARNFVKLFGQTPYEEAKTYFIAGASQVDHSLVEQAKRDGKKIVLRVDNILRNSRNRNSGMSRMKAFAEMADLVIYQSRWARSLLRPYLNRDGPVILNGVDTSVFKLGTPQSGHYLYARSSRDEGKGWLNAWYWWVKNNPGHLNIAGKFSRENLEYNFDFFNSESYTFLGERNDMPDIFRNNQYFLYTYLNDACSNTLLEARASGCEIIDVDGMLQTGGAPEIMALTDKEITIERMGAEYEQIL